MGGKKRVSLKDIPVQRTSITQLRPDLSPAQVTMFSEGVTARQQQDEAARHAGLVTVGSALDVLFGGPVDRESEVTKIALEVITDGPRLELSLDQWNRVQMLVEAAVKAGSDAEQSGRL